jgi:maltose-binding protein MalE
MRKFLALAIVAAFVLCIPAFAAETKTAQTKAAEKTDHAHGTITAWDEAGKTFKVKDKAGKEWDFSWNEKTKVVGTPKVGETVSLHYTKDKDGKAWASHITIGSPGAAKKETTKSK